MTCGKEFFKDHPLKPNLTTGLKSTLRGPKWVRQRTHKNCELDTLAGGFKANGEPCPAFLIVKAKMMHKELTRSWVEDEDGNPMKVTSPSLMSGGSEIEALVVCTANRGMNPELNKKCVARCRASTPAL